MSSLHTQLSALETDLDAYKVDRKKQETLLEYLLDNSLEYYGDCSLSEIETALNELEETIKAVESEIHEVEFQIKQEQWQDDYNDRYQDVIGHK